MTDKNSTNSAESQAGETPSEVSASLTLLHGIEAFSRHLQQILANGARRVHILATRLDPLLFSCEEVCDLLSAIARRHRQAEIFILVRDTRDLAGSGHKLIELHRRLPSKVHLRKITTENDADNRAFVIVDGAQLLYQHSDGDFEGFCDTQAGPEAQALLEEFRELWSRQSEDIKDVRQLSL